MNRFADISAVVGGTALAGFGVVPFLHREGPPDAWFRLHWPRVVDEDAVVAALRHLASARRPDVVTFELQTTAQRAVHFVGVAKADSGLLRHLFATFLPDVLLEPVDREPAAVARAVEVRLGSRERALRVDAVAEIALSVVGALAGTTGTTVVQWQIGPRLAPLHVPPDSIGLPSAGRSVGQAFRYGLAPLDAKARGELQNKVGDQGFRATLRIGTSIAEPAVAKGVLRSALGGLRVAEAPGVLFKSRRANVAAVAAALPMRRFGMAINVSELAGLLGWPVGDGDYVGVVRAGSRRLKVPATVSAKGRILGDGSHPMTRRPIAVGARDGLMHVHVLGPTGVGKSTLLANIALQSIAAGEGVTVIEPKGDLVQDILARIPKRREADVVVLDPSDDAAPVGLNPLAGGDAELVSDQVMAVFRGMYGDYLGPRTSDVLHAALLTLAKSEQSTLTALPLVLTDAGLRRRITKNLADDLALGPFWSWYEGLSDAERQQVIAPVMNKVRIFVLRERVRHVLGQRQPRFNIADIFSDRKILLVPLSKGVLGSETASLVGSLVVARLWQAAQARSRVAPERRHPVTMIIDEFQDFLHLPTDLADVLVQARGLGLGLVLAHQHLAQLTPSMRAAVMANARSRVAFRLAADDGAIIAKTSDLLEAKDLQGLGRYEIYASLVAQREAQPFCSATTRPLPGIGSDARRIRELSRRSYGTPREDIEAELRELVNGQAAARDAAVGSRRRRPKIGSDAGDDR